MVERYGIFYDISLERAKQEILKEAGKFKYTCADKGMSPGDKVAVLGEEFGEVCRASLNVQGLSTDSRDRAQLEHELIQVAAVAVAWLEALRRL